MTTQARRPLWQTIFRRRSRTLETAPTTEPAGPSTVDAAPIDIQPDDPAVAYFQSASGVVDVEHVDIDSPAIQAMKEAGATCLAIDAGKCLLIDGNAIIQAANEGNMAIVAG